VWPTANQTRFPRAAVSSLHRLCMPPRPAPRLTLVSCSGAQAGQEARAGERGCSPSLCGAGGLSSPSSTPRPCTTCMGVHVRRVRPTGVHGLFMSSDSLTASTRALANGGAPKQRRPGAAPDRARRTRRGLVHHASVRPCCYCHPRPSRSARVCDLRERPMRMYPALMKSDRLAKHSSSCPPSRLL
jgi:hypothetical protein